MLVVLGLGLALPSARCDTITIPAAADTTLFEYNPDFNLGGYISLAAGTTASLTMGKKSRALMKFDIARNVPAGAVISRAILHLTVVKTPGSGGTASTFATYRVLLPWGEGDKALSATGLPASNGEATWNHRFYPSAAWADPGAAAGVDYALAQTSSASIAGLGIYNFDSTAEAVADVQRWLDNPGSNNGWILICDSEDTFETARRFGAHESGGSGPNLEIEYSFPFFINSYSRSGSSFKLFFSVEPFFTYTVESSSTLAPGSWTTLTNFTEEVSAYEAVASDSIVAPKKFYRVLKEPCLCQ